MSAQRLEVRGGLGDDVLLNLHDDFLEPGFAADVHGKENFDVGLVDFERGGVASLVLFEVLRFGGGLGGGGGGWGAG